MKNVKLVNKYVKTARDCPFCASYINAPIVTGPNTTKLHHHHNVDVRQQVQCPACGSKWIDVYKLTDIIEVEDTKGTGY